MSLIVTSQPIAEPVSVDEVKARLRLTTTDDDGTITRNIVAAREFAEKITRRSLVPKGYTASLDRFPWPHDPIRLPAPPLIQVQSILYMDETMTQQTWSPSEYWVAQKQDPALISPRPGMIYPSTARVYGAVEINFTAGYGAAPFAAIPAGANPAVPAIPGTPICFEHILEGVRQLAAHIYSHPEVITSEGMQEIPVAMMTFFTMNKVYVF